jgi:hypothetical protein
VRRLLLVTCATALLAGAGVAGAQPNTARSWAAPQIQTVVASGLMGPSVESFRPDDSLTWGEFTTVLASLGVNVWVDDLDRPVTIRELDQQLVTAAGLRAAAVRFAVPRSPRAWRRRPPSERKRWRASSASG